MVGVSPDSARALQSFRAKHGLDFVLLSDPDHVVSEMYGAWGEKKSYGKTYMGINRSHFLIDEDGKIVDAQIRVSPRESVERALAACCSD